ncbi:MAG: 4'-phosphopantetheinyl transferase superfamily protein [Desulfobulbus sp.]|nr:4'-phosphopantetheinyl transferase superfamily protein [Desulfobulbus sp.]
MKSLQPGQVHVWLLNSTQVNDVGLLARYEHLLSSDEREHRQKFYFEKDRRRYLCTRALERFVLSEYTHVPPEQWHFERNAYWKPEISRSRHPEIPPLRFNLSHTDGYIACALTLENDIGVDIEQTKRQTDVMGIAAHYFSEDEIKDLRTCSPEQQQRKFFEFWTLKEAYMKARGMGLQIPLDAVTFSRNGGQVHISFSPACPDVPEWWQLHHYQLQETYALSLAVATANRLDPQQVLLTECIPFRSTAPVPHRLLYRS